MKKITDDTYDLVLKYKKGWSQSQRKAAKEKVGALTKADTKVVKNPPRKAGTKKRLKKQEEK